MATKPRRSLAAMDDEAIAVAPEFEPAAAVETQRPSTAEVNAYIEGNGALETSALTDNEQADIEKVAEEVDATKPDAEDRAKRDAAANAAEDKPSRVGVYLTDSEVDNARAAFVYDWDHGGNADSFGAWVSEAISAYAALTAVQRKERAPAMPARSGEKTGKSRGYLVPAPTVARMRAEIVVDRHAQRIVSVSRWAREAIIRATNNARDNNGGNLPVVLGRLPGKMVR